MLRNFSIKPPKNPKRSLNEGIGPVSWKNLGITAALGGGLYAFMLYLKNEKDTSEFGKIKIINEKICRLHFNISA